MAKKGIGVTGKGQGESLRDPKNDYKDLVARGLLNPSPPLAGRFQWGIFVASDVCKLRELFVEGDEIRVASTGALEILRELDHGDGLKERLLSRIIGFLESLGGNGQRYQKLLVLPASKWKAAYLTDPISGAIVCCHDWPELSISIEDWIQRGGR